MDFTCQSSTPTTSPTPSEFPLFTDGDVTLIISTTRHYRLHSHTLRQKSSYFEQHLRPGFAPKLAPAARKAGYTPWRFQLCQATDIEGDMESFVPIPMKENGQVQNIAILPRVSSNSLTGTDPDIVWYHLFGCLYGLTPDFDTTTFAATLAESLSLVNAAESLSAVESVREPIDLALLSQDTYLWKSIATNPTAWVTLAHRIKSPIIFREAAVHVIGQWKMLTPETRDALPADVYQLCKTKWEELDLAKRAIEIRIAGHYPSFLHQNATDRPRRTAYAREIYMWQAIAHFRQYVSQSGNDGLNRTAEDGGYAWYKRFATGGNAYLTHEDLAVFHRYFPMSRKACRVLEGHMNVLKEEIKGFVSELMVCRTHIGVEVVAGVGRGWLTCAVVRVEDLPW